MASVFGHSLVAGAFAISLPKELKKPKVIILGILCSIAPDADILAFNFGIPYESFWGHRGATHSICFGILLGVLMSFIFHRSTKFKYKTILAGYYSFCAISHGFLDAMTTGGRGIAFFSPFDNERYFLPFRMIQVSPIGASRFFSKWGMEVLKSEAVWIGVPCLFFVVIVYIIKSLKRRNSISRNG